MKFTVILPVEKYSIKYDVTIMNNDVTRMNDDVTRMYDDVKANLIQASSL